MLKLTNPGPFFLNASGTLLTGGELYVGTASTDPLVSPIPAYYDKAKTMLAAQPLRIVGGRIVNESLSPASIFIDADDYSLLVRDTNGVQIDYFARANAEEVTFQEQDADLTTIAGQANTPYGLGLLTLADQDALKDAVGNPDSLPVIGGTVSGNIIRAAAGVHLYFTDPNLQSGRVFVTAQGVGDPTSLPGDIWITVG